MKVKVIVGSVFLVLIATGVALAGQAKNNCGCGFGSMLWADRADGSILSQTMQVTTNGFLGNQTFGITSGTLGCEQPENIGADDQAFAYVRDNLDGLATDIALGHGERLETLAELLAVPSTERPAFAGTLQGSFEEIFVTGEEDAATILERITLVAG